jgi:protein-glutamine gamma-glutamyltransferase
MRLRSGTNIAMKIVDRPFLNCIRSASVLGLLSLTLTQEIDFWFLGIAWISLIASLWMDTRPELQSRLRHIETFAVVLMAITFLIDFAAHHLSFFVSIAHFLILFQMFKWIGLKERKDGLQIVCFSFFQILAACTLSLDIWQAFVFIALIPVATMALFWHQVEIHRERGENVVSPEVRRAFIRLARIMAAVSLPLNLLLTVSVFLLFPRLTWNTRIPLIGQNRTAYTDQVNLAHTGSLAQDNSVALWLRMPQADRRHWSGYLRGTTMETFDGFLWTPRPNRESRDLLRGGKGIFKTTPGPLPPSGLIHQTITLLNPTASTLFASAFPLQVESPLNNVLLDDNGCLRWTDHWERPLRYETISDERDVGPEMQLSNAEELTASLALPQQMQTSQIGALSRRIAGGGDALSKAQRIEIYLQRNFVYSTELAGGVSSNPVEDFLFRRKRGPCGHFASAMALMLRLQGIPARLVAGYRRGEYNEMADVYVIRAKDAHAWVEVFSPGKGWIRFDPTPSVQTPLGFASRALHRAGQYWELIQFQWSRLVLDYDLYAQIRTFVRLRESSDRATMALAGWWQRHAPRLAKASSPAPAPGHLLKKPWTDGSIAIMLCLLAVLWKRHRAALAADASITSYRRFLGAMARRGVAKEAFETGREFAERACRAHPALSSFVWQATNSYYETRFGRQA